MRKIFLSAVVLTVAGLMLHGAVACELNREANGKGSVAVVGCSDSGCVFDPPQGPFASLNEHLLPDPAKDCGGVYFDLDIYTGTNGLMVWLIGTLGAEREYRLGVGFPPSPMDANAQYR